MLWRGNIDRRLLHEREAGVTYVVNFYHPNCGHCVELVPEWTRFAKLTAGGKIRAGAKLKFFKKKFKKKILKKCFHSDNTPPRHNIFTKKKLTLNRIGRFKLIF